MRDLMMRTALVMVVAGVALYLAATVSMGF
jgi:hypothetical protein